MRRALGALAGVLLLACAAGALPAQVAPAPRPAVVVQIAGATLYLDVGTDGGVTAGDTLTVRRAPTAGVVGAAVVIAATSARSVLAFVGAPFPVTRGDTLFITPGAAGVAAATARVALPESRTQTRAVPRVDALGGTRVDGSLGFEMWGSHSEIVGLGADPTRSTRDLAIPAVRLRSRVSNANSSLDLNLRAEYRTGPASVFDRSTRVRIYGARYDRRAGDLHLTAGRFFSDFDHASGFWDGVSARLGISEGLTGGLAAGFEPLRGNEGFSTEIPKFAAFIGLRRGGERVDVETDLAFHRTFASDYARQRQAVDWSLHLRSGRFTFAQEIEASPPTLIGTWGVSRFIVRSSATLGRTQVYASAVSDRPLVMDTAWTQPLDRRERVAAGVSHQLRSGSYYDVNVAINGPRDSTTGYSTGVMAAFPGLLGSGTLSINGSYFTSGGNRGVTAAPSIEYRLGVARLRGGYQFFTVSTPASTVTTHGVDFRFNRSLSDRLDWVAQVNGRLGGNIRSTTFYSSLELRF